MSPSSSRPSALRRVLCSRPLAGTTPETAATTAALCFDVDDRTHALALRLVADLVALEAPPAGCVPPVPETTTPEEFLHV